MITLPDIKINLPGLPEINPGFCSLGLVIPFQPSMVDSKTIHQVLSYTLEIVQTKLENKYESEEIRFITERLKKIFSRLNFNSHRKSVAIMIREGDEKIIYLNYSGTPVFFFDDAFSLLDLVGQSARNPEFELLVFSKNGAALYEYFNNSLHKVFTQTEESSANLKNGTDSIMQRISHILQQVNKKNDKPIFIYSQNEQQTNKFCKFFPYSEIVFKLTISLERDDTDEIKLLTEKINHQWKYWQNNLVRGQISIAKRYQSLYSHLNSVIKALKHSSDGLLLVDEFMKDEIHNSLSDQTHSEAVEKLTGEIEKFLARGNRIEITGGGLLDLFGGIALIRESESTFDTFRHKRIYKEEDFMI